MKDLFGSFGLVVFGFCLLLGLCAIGTYFHLEVYRDVAPKYAKVEREVFLNTPSYIQGKIGDLVRYRAQYQAAADAEHRATLKQVILATAATMDRQQLPPDLQQFVDDLERSTR